MGSLQEEVVYLQLVQLISKLLLIRLAALNRDRAWVDSLSHLRALLLSSATLRTQ